MVYCDNMRNVGLVQVSYPTKHRMRAKVKGGKMGFERDTEGR